MVSESSGSTAGFIVILCVPEGVNVNTSFTHEYILAISTAMFVAPVGSRLEYNTESASLVDPVISLLKSKYNWTSSYILSIAIISISFINSARCCNLIEV